ncbi:ABC transporter ATP-binding protein [Ruegeria profundi]|uniref:Methionine ABC transporter ATP-binding protein n=1 Tax=Ruegeria profundi TaxID=1685378 RepID=A0A0X3TU95_9RHOB|nr:ABC transporter ATP-binding protein [Ruegeria profundi]KUJ79257.1 methionine ABC transporter ATP-binding protein [Ruegeria profundi]
MNLRRDDPILNMSGVRFQWPGRTSFALNVPAFCLQRGETVLLLGESGSGKSTLLSLICGTLQTGTGTIAVSGTDLAALSGAGRDRLRAEQIGVIFQQFNLLPFATVSDNILLPLRFAPNRRSRTKMPFEEATRLCRSLGLPDDLLGQRAASLSVGQQQRVAVARALIGQPPLMIADEPTSSLDAGSQNAFLDLMFGQLGEIGASLLMVSHDPRLGDRFDRVVELSDIAMIEGRAA